MFGSTKQKTRQWYVVRVAGVVFDFIIITLVLLFGWGRGESSSFFGAPCLFQISRFSYYYRHPQKERVFSNGHRR
jgi:hypothetical protein